MPTFQKKKKPAKQAAGRAGASARWATASGGRPSMSLSAGNVCATSLTAAPDPVPASLPEQLCGEVGIRAERGIWGGAA